jgi:hypothetical protein
MALKGREAMDEERVVGGSDGRSPLEPSRTEPGFSSVWRPRGFRAPPPSRRAALSGVLHLSTSGAGSRGHAEAPQPHKQFVGSLCDYRMSKTVLVILMKGASSRGPGRGIKLWDQAFPPPSACPQSTKHYTAVILAQISFLRLTGVASPEKLPGREGRMLHHAYRPKEALLLTTRRP